MNLPTLLAAALGGLVAALVAPARALAAPAIFVNQIAYDARGPKIAVVRVDGPPPAAVVASLIDDATEAVQATIPLRNGGALPEWAPGQLFYRADFSRVTKPGTYRLRVVAGGAAATSERFRIDEAALAKMTVPAIVKYFFKQRATRPEEWTADAAVQLNDGSRRVDMRGGWCDASGDVSKYFSHLAYSNFMGPQQTPMVTWELLDAAERVGPQLGAQADLQAEALWGADYLYRALAPEGYFHMVVFSFFSARASDRKVVGLLADSKTDNRWQASFRSGGGLAVAALARASRWKKDGIRFTAAQYLDGARRAFAHLLVHNRSYLYDGQENIIDDYAALMAATELWIATDEVPYRDEARRRARNLVGRLTPGGYFRAGAGARPFWHAVDAGLPVIALVRYLDKETDPAARAPALGAIAKNLDYQLAVTNAVANPFGHARHSFLHEGAVREAFFMPHANETGWWWQGENARLASLATAALLGGRLVRPAKGGWGVEAPLARFAAQQIAWIVGGNPYGVSFLHGFGAKNPPPIKSSFGHGTETGGIANGITGRKGRADGSGIDYRPDDGDEWRWSEQWIPNAGWFLIAVSAMAQRSSPSSGRIRGWRHEEGSVIDGAQSLPGPD